MRQRRRPEPGSFRRRAVISTALAIGVGLGFLTRVEAQNTPPGCEGLATIDYGDCRVAHVLQCADYRRGVVLRVVKDGDAVAMLRLEAGLVSERYEAIRVGSLTRIRRVSGPTAEALLATGGLNAPIEVASMVEVVDAAGAETAFTVTETYSEMREETLNLVTGPETVRVIAVEVSETLAAGDVRVLFYAPDIGSVIGWRADLDADGGDRDATPIAVRRPGDPRFLNSSAGVGCETG